MLRLDVPTGEEMPNLASPSIRNVSDTALWVAVYRAEESDREDALFCDFYARGLAGERGQAIVDALPFGRSMGWSIVVRTAVMDAVILRCIERGARTVLNLGAGLDTRAFRLRLPAKLRWLDVDFPAVTAYRRESLGSEVAACRHVHVEADLRHSADRDSVIRDASKGGPLLVITEGLLVYLAPEQVNELATQLGREANARWWVADLITPLLQQTMGLLWGAQLNQAEAPFRFAPVDAKAYFRDLNWWETEFHSTWVDSIRLKRAAPNALLWDTFLKWTPPRPRWQRSGCPVSRCSSLRREAPGRDLRILRIDEVLRLRLSRRLCLLNAGRVPNLPHQSWCGPSQRPLRGGVLRVLTGCSGSSLDSRFDGLNAWNLPSALNKCHSAYACRRQSCPSGRRAWSSSPQSRSRLEASGFVPLRQRHVRGVIEARIVGPTFDFDPGRL